MIIIRKTLRIPTSKMTAILTFDGVFEALKESRIRVDSRSPIRLLNYEQMGQLVGRADQHRESNGFASYPAGSASVAWANAPPRGVSLCRDLDPESQPSLLAPNG
jgi:hypothetical protein